MQARGVEAGRNHMSRYTEPMKVIGERRRREETTIQIATPRVIRSLANAILCKHASSVRNLFLTGGGVRRCREGFGRKRRRGH